MMCAVMRLTPAVVLACAVISIHVMPTATAESTEGFVVVQTETGLVRGTTGTTLFDNKQYFTFKGIPYAEPPVAQLRFKAPVPKTPWSDTLDARQYGSACIQRTALFDDQQFGVEDCLSLNVFTPSMNPALPLAVMFYIHGGGFFEGSGNQEFNGPDFLINEGVIVVTFNYRLGIFGFLSLATPEYSGNMGLKDQRLALRWVKNNIHRFGGDPDNITVFGHSAGAASTHIHVLTAPTGLFHRAIAMSGSALNTFAIHDGGDHIEFVDSLFQLTTPSTGDTDSLEFLLNADADFLTENSNINNVSRFSEAGAHLYFTPVVEVQGAEDPILLNHPKDIYKNGFSTTISAMFGYTSAETLFFIAPQVTKPEHLESVNANFTVPLPFTAFNKYSHTLEFRAMLTEARDFYFGAGVKIDQNSIDKYIEIWSDTMFVYGINEAVKQQADASTGRTYYYRFSVQLALNVFKMLSKATNRFGASHGDELCYIFRCGLITNLYIRIKNNSDDLRVIRDITKVWTNFAKYGEPTPEGHSDNLKPVSRNELNLIEINNEGISGTHAPQENFKFWEQLNVKYTKIFSQKYDGRDEL